MPSESIFNIVRAITAKLFKAEDRRLDMVISSLNQRNKRLHDVKVDGFLHAGVFYLPKDATLRSGASVAKVTLHLSLQDEMEAHMLDRRLVLEEQGFIRQILHTLLRPCQTDQQIRDTLPECIVNSLPSFSRLSRREETAYTLRDNPRAFRQFEKILPKIEFYSVAKLLY